MPNKWKAGLVLIAKPETRLRWVPLVGAFDIKPDSVTFKGRSIEPESVPQGQQPPTSPPVKLAAVGLLASNRVLADGRLGARVRFADVSPNTVFEFALGRDLERQNFVSAGVGGGASAFGIREIGPPPNPTAETAPKVWTFHRGAGERSFVERDREYEVQVTLEGGQISLRIDTVPVATTVVPTLRGGPLQVGLFLMNEHEIVVSAIEIQPKTPKAFVVMPFSGEFDELHQYVIREACKTFEVFALRADEMAGPGVVIDDIVREIEASRLIIAEITHANPNVFFEIGYARAVGKPIVLLAQKGTKPPFDIAGFRVIFYEDTIGGKARLDEGLKKHIAEVLFGYPSFS